jgi:1-acyl-sn-glycerol-3-phosphate acyltransferase
MMAVWSLGLAILGPPLIFLTVITRREEFTTLPAMVVVLAGLRAGGVRVSVAGRERIDPNAVYVYTPNHQSLLDAPIAWTTLGTPRRRVGFLVKTELERVPIFGYGIKAIGMIPVERGNRDRAIASALRATEVLHKGRSFAVFPEGTRTRNGRLRPFKKGAFHMAIEAGVPIVPVTIAGAFEAMPSGTLRLEPVPILVTLHEPIPTAGLTHEDVDELLERTRATIASALPTEIGAGATASGDSTSMTSSASEVGRAGD